MEMQRMSSLLCFWLASGAAVVFVVGVWQRHKNNERHIEPDVDVDVDVAIDTTSTSLRSTTKYRSLQQDNGDSDEKPWKYSDYATIVPDPEYDKSVNENKFASKGADSDSDSDDTIWWKPWHFWDGDQDNRSPVHDCTKYPPVCDVPSEEWEDDSWQVDAVFVNHILDAGGDMIRQAIEAIFVEYGYKRAEKLEMHELVNRNKMFQWQKVDTAKKENQKVQPDQATLMQGGWTTARSVAGLARRLLHAVMVNDEFTVVVIGKQATAGLGNHFHQSYAMQLHRVVAPVLARLGVRLTTLNLANRHVGSVPAALGKTWGDTRGIDLVVWDEGHTERSPREKDLFLRQVVLQSATTGKVPVVWMGGIESDWELLQLYHNQADLDMGRFGTAMSGVPLTTSDETAQTLPYAAQYLHCDAQQLGVCRQALDEYCAKCWIDRSDIADPKTLFPNITSNDNVPHQYEWNPGWRQHQLTARLLSHTILSALQDALDTFMNGAMGGPPLDPDEWFMADYYQNIRDKLKAMAQETTPCAEWQGILPSRVCTLALNGVTQYTPRAGPSIADLIKGASSSVPSNTEKVMYDGYDVHNTCYDNPDSNVPDIVGIVSGRRRRLTGAHDNNNILMYEEKAIEKIMPEPFARIHQARRRDQQELKLKQEEKQRHRRQQEQSSRNLLETGAGWRIVDEVPGQCDGQYASICGREASSTCPLLGHHDSAGVVQGDESTGWIVLELENVQHGLIMAGLRLTAKISSAQRERKLERPDEIDSVANLPASFVLDISMDGKSVSWDKAQFLQHFRPQVQRGFDVLILLDEAEGSFTPPDSSAMEVGLRIRDCKDGCTLGLTHIFWA